MSRSEYLTLKGNGESKIEIKQSVFIGQAVRIYSPEDADAFVRKVKSDYPDARHNCYAWLLSSGVKMQKYSDDGEPSGTAGLPLLSVLEKNNITDCAVAVTRYFGGILLGKGGLIRAYTEAASEAVANAGVVKIIEGTSFSMEFGYESYEKMSRYVTSKGWEITGTEYTDNVKMSFILPSYQIDEMLDEVTEMSSARILPVKIGTSEMACEV